MDARRGVGVVALLTLVAACGGSSTGTVTPVPPAPPFTSVPQVRVSAPSMFASGCDGVASETGTVYPNTAVEPYLIINPYSENNLVAAWQQDRWSNGGSRGLMLASSVDGGNSWTRTSAPFSRCTGGNISNFGDYARATDPWLTATPNGVVYALSLSFNGTTLAPNSSSAMLVARSADFGVTWQLPHALIQDGDTVFNDKGSITADPINSSYVYAVWDRMTSTIAGPTYFAVTADGGSTWQPARFIYDPGPSAQTIGNQIIVLPGDLLLDVFTEIDTQGATKSSFVRVIRSVDNGATWSAPATISDLQAVGTSNPANNAPVRDGSELVSVSTSATAGVIYIAWQDSRFSMGNHDGIALVRSIDAGQSWSAPVQVNADINVQAFTPTVNVRDDGVVALTYFDLRNNTTASTSTLYSDYWMVVSTDGGATFTEQHIAGSFNLYNAPDAEGLFLGDYQALINTGISGAFVPFSAQPELPAGAPATDALISFPPRPAAAAAMPFAAVAAATGLEVTAEARARITARTRYVQSQRLRGR